MPSKTPRAVRGDEQHADGVARERRVGLDVRVHLGDGHGGADVSAALEDAAAAARGAALADGGTGRERHDVAEAELHAHAHALQLGQDRLHLLVLDAERHDRRRARLDACHVVQLEHILQRRHDLEWFYGGLRFVRRFLGLLGDNWRYSARISTARPASGSTQGAQRVDPRRKQQPAPRTLLCCSFGIVSWKSFIACRVSHDFRVEPWRLRGLGL